MSRSPLRLDLSIPRSWLAGALVAVLLAAAASHLGSENVTMSTYYPAPSGVYTQMLTTQNTFLARDGGNVGIGTSRPAEKLDVRGGAGFSGTVSVGGFKMPPGAKANYVLTTDAAGAASWQRPGALPSSYSTMLGYPVHGGNCAMFPQWVPVKFLGVGKVCMGLLTGHAHNPGGSCGRYEDNACRYNPATGNLEGAASSGTTYCGYVCFN